jgi:hypothetical protein
VSARAADRARPGRSRRRQTWRELFSDPVRKLIALALAILLWLFLDSQITDRTEPWFKLIGERQARDANEPEIRDSHIVLKPPPGYRVTGFRDHMTQTEVVLVEVAFEAPQHVLRNALATPGLYVQPRPSEINQQNVFVFDKDDLRSDDAVVLKAIRDMKPRRIDVQLEKIDEKPVALDHTVVRVVYPDPKVFPDFADRLHMDDAVFVPPQVMLRGPRSRITEVLRNEPLFTLDLSQAGATPDFKVVAQLTPLPLEKLTVEGGPVTITVPLDPQFESYELLVPVHSFPPDKAEHKPAIPVNVRVCGELAAVLSRLETAEERNEWARRNAYVYVALGEDFGSDKEVLPGTFNINNESYERGRHYRTEGLLQVEVKPKKDG